MLSILPTVYSYSTNRTPRGHAAGAARTVITFGQRSSKRLGPLWADGINGVQATGSLVSRRSRVEGSERLIVHGPVAQRQRSEENLLSRGGARNVPARRSKHCYYKCDRFWDSTRTLLN